MTDPAIIEAAARALRELDIQESIAMDYGYNFTAREVLAAVTPLIESAALERAALVAEEHAADYIADEIRALKLASPVTDMTEAETKDAT